MFGLYGPVHTPQNLLCRMHGDRFSWLAVLRLSVALFRYLLLDHGVGGGEGFCLRWRDGAASQMAIWRSRALHSFLALSLSRVFGHPRLFAHPPPPLLYLLCSPTDLNERESMHTSAFWPRPPKLPISAAF